MRLEENTANMLQSSETHQALYQKKVCNIDL